MEIVLCVLCPFLDDKVLLKDRVRFKDDRIQIKDRANDLPSVKDLIGINVVDKKNNLVGKIKAIHNFGAGDIIELNSNFSHMVRFDSKNIVKIDLLKKSIILSFEMSDYVK